MVFLKLKLPLDSVVRTWLIISSGFLKSLIQRKPRILVGVATDTQGQSGLHHGIIGSIQRFGITSRVVKRGLRGSVLLDGHQFRLVSHEGLVFSVVGPRLVAHAAVVNGPFGLGLLLATVLFTGTQRGGGQRTGRGGGRGGRGGRGGQRTRSRCWSGLAFFRSCVALRLLSDFSG